MSKADIPDGILVFNRLGGGGNASVVATNLHVNMR
ncbi:hypothetical protein MESS2_1500004 [Mesorhizobium metallidurans STM 2683]|uniref:Uncharacterized protein n=1 Tax=Mesorhizobium metallidurans STM 2683 TaxID=1297569 RepID=M5EK75_9HYPH|nr:hypothetical protein MESS2_1500004 [Mesorhizobium metallidurans STM 2683]